jgi:molybdopterin/thiamine biosynthesis adenylyltransferase
MQLAVYGKESMRRMATANVLIIGLNGLGCEVGELSSLCMEIMQHSMGALS